VFRRDTVLLVCVKGKFLAIEAKAEAKSKVTPLQQKNIVAIGDASGYATIIYDTNIDQLNSMMHHLGATPK